MSLIYVDRLDASDQDISLSKPAEKNSIEKDVPGVGRLAVVSLFAWTTQTELLTESADTLLRSAQVSIPVRYKVWIIY